MFKMMRLNISVNNQVEYTLSGGMIVTHQLHTKTSLVDIFAIYAVTFTAGWGRQKRIYDV